jgi:RNA polymerase sigma-70 factor (ECF subfamily)
MSRNSSTERTLIERLQAGDDSAVAELMSLYGPKVYQLAYRHLRSHEDAEEVAQDVLLKVYRKINAFRGDAALSSWIYRITFNAAMSRLRSQKFSRPFEVPTESVRADEDGRRTLREYADWSSLGDEAVLRGEVRERFTRAMRQLPSVYRTPVMLRDVKGMSTDEASKVLHVNTQTLKSRLHRGRVILRRQLADFATGTDMHRAA